MNINPAIRGKLTVVARGEVSSPSISADGDVVVYNQFKDGETAVYRHEGEDTVKLTTDGHASMHADVSADGSKVVFTRYDNVNNNGPGSWDIALWDENTGRTTLVSAEPGNEMSPSISDDGNVIVWDDDVDGKFGQNNIVKSVNGEVKQITDSESLDLFPAMSGDGNRIVWRRYIKGKAHVFIEDQNGVVKPYLERDGSIVRPRLSHDGQLMIYADQSGEDEDLMRYDDLSGEISSVAAVSNVKETWGDISGDGKTITWTGLDFRKGSPADTNVYMMQDGESIQVTTAQGGSNNEARISHDGKSLVWTWIDDESTNNRVIYKLDLDDSGEAES